MCDRHIAIPPVSVLYVLSILLSIILLFFFQEVQKNNVKKIVLTKNITQFSHTKVLQKLFYFSKPKRLVVLSHLSIQSSTASKKPSKHNKEKITGDKKRKLVV